MELKESKTYINIQKAFESELQITSKYLIYALKARQDGYVQIGNIFDQIAGNDRELANIWLKQLNDGKTPDTLTNLVDATQISNKQGTSTYQEYSRVAQEEGFAAIASLFNGIANIQLNHENVFSGLAADVRTNSVFCKETQNLWICLRCGNIMGGECAPKICPICGFPQAYYQIYVNEVN